MDGFEGVGVVEGGGGGEGRDAGWRLESVRRSIRLWGIFINPVLGTDSHNGRAESRCHG